MNCNLELYTGPRCELCEIAKALIDQTLPAGSYQLELIDATSSPDLKKVYGLRIPVLRDITNGDELAWPFSAEQVLDFCRPAR